ncbi:MAG: S-methyl-5'-thioadenosine phosphorylase, partial [Candidatus Bathyarchaeia archaeon]
MRWKTNIAIIGGTGLDSILDESEHIRIGTPYGFPSSIRVGEVSGKTVAFLLRHDVGHTIPPHRVNFRANIYALREIGVERIIATNAVGAINL